jgi:simple sugar transport system ATP-binding protein
MEKNGNGMPLIEAKDIGKSFDGIEALRDVSLRIDAGEVIGLMGDNGAGKSTLIRIVAGNYPPDRGAIYVDGELAQFRRAVEARKKGIEAVYQDLALCNNLTAAENVFLGREIRKSIGPLRILDYPAMHRRTVELFQELQSETRPGDVVRTMSGGERQAVAIARARLSDPRLVLMDEPTSAISVRQVAELLKLVHRLRGHGIAVVLVSHRSEDVFAVADRVVVLHRGRKVMDARRADTSPEDVERLLGAGVDHGRR